MAIGHIYRTINIPSDCSEDPDERFELAILQCQATQKIFHMPCNWVRVWDDGENVRVREDFHKPEGVTMSDREEMY